ncbi:hypothetical protein [Anditalea andensis]|uniref:Uncharacterized protein n=1 Tax=Anditalea andensis TaxID=1048983 RepID=A0A074KY24_9BACT|nr:hypothetical protein [Anditalea andensis]KEO72503.1 hypothetical protein EL17_17345 [Anditalea andensis]
MSIQSIPSAQDNFAFQSISKNSDLSIGSLSVLEIMDSCEFIDLRTTKTFDFVGHPEAGKQYTVIGFSLSGKAAALKGLFNGIISLGNPKEVGLTYQADLDTYVFKYYQKDQHIAIGYLQKIIKMIESEIRFKAVLKKVIENIKAFDFSQQFLRNEIFN